MRAAFKVLQEIISKGENAVIVSQFTSMLSLVFKHLINFDVKSLVLTGAVFVKDRLAVVKEFNSPSSRPKVR